MAIWINHAQREWHLVLADGRGLLIVSMDHGHDGLFFLSSRSPLQGSSHKLAARFVDLPKRAFSALRPMQWSVTRLSPSLRLGHNTMALVLAHTTHTSKCRLDGGAVIGPVVGHGGGGES